METSQNNQVSWNTMAIVGFCVAVLSILWLVMPFLIPFSHEANLSFGMILRVILTVILGITSFILGIIGIIQIVRTKGKGIIFAILALLPLFLDLFLLWVSSMH